MNMHEQLPEGWVKTTIKDIAGINPGVDTFFLDDSTLVSFVPMASVEANTGRMDSSQTRLLSAVKHGFTSFVENDILLAKITPCMENGKFAIAQNLSAGIGFGSTEFHVIRAEKDVNQHLLYYYFSQECFRKAARTAMTGSSGQLRVPAVFLAETPYLLPPTNEQARIVAAIEQQFSRLDSAVASLRSAQAKTKQLRASLLKAAVEGELTKAWREANPVSETGQQLLERILDERRARWEEEQLAKMREKGKVPLTDEWKKGYKEPRRADVEKLPGLPQGWCWATVEQLAQIQGGIQKQPIRAPKNNAYPYLRVANVLRGRLDLDNVEKMELFGNELEILRLEVGDLLVVEGNGSKTEIGRSALWKGEIENCVHQNHIIRVRLDQISPKYMDFYWNSPEGNRRVMNVAASTTGLYTLSVNKISRLPIPLPPLAEQAQIVAEIEANFSELAKTEEIIEHNLRRAEQERQSILREAFAGRLVEQNPEDEPASVLLSRIREEREKREAEEQERRKEARKMINTRRPRTLSNDRQRIYYTLAEADAPLKPEEVFTQSGFKADEQPESVEAFQVALTPLLEAGAVKQERPDSSTVTLEALELPETQLENVLDVTTDEPENVEQVADSAEPAREKEPGQIYQQLSLLDEAPGEQ